MKMSLNKKANEIFVLAGEFFEAAGAPIKELHDRVS
jgi:hypothetical protein